MLTFTANLMSNGKPWLLDKIKKKWISFLSVRIISADIYELEEKSTILKNVYFESRCK